MFEAAENAPVDGKRVTDIALPVGSRLIADVTRSVIHNLTVSATVDGEDRTYRFVVRRTGIDRVDKPAWTDDVPAGAWLNPTLS
ncbi:MAG: hypothetical protein V5A39_09560 [Haloarculaceae archaeon]